MMDNRGILDKINTKLMAREMGLEDKRLIICVEGEDDYNCLLHYFSKNQLDVIGDIVFPCEDGEKISDDTKLRGKRAVLYTLEKYLGEFPNLRALVDRDNQEFFEGLNEKAFYYRAHELESHLFEEAVLYQLIYSVSKQPLTATQISDLQSTIISSYYFMYYHTKLRIWRDKVFEENKPKLLEQIKTIINCFEKNIVRKSIVNSDIKDNHNEVILLELKKIFEDQKLDIKVANEEVENLLVKKGIAFPKQIQDFLFKYASGDIALNLLNIILKREQIRELGIKEIDGRIPFKERLLKEVIPIYSKAYKSVIEEMCVAE